MASVEEISGLPEREERIKARRRRAEAALRKDKDAGRTQKADDAAAEEAARPALKAKLDAFAQMERVKEDTWQELTDVRVTFDDAENQRRIVEENARLDRFEALQIEAVTSGRKNAAVEMKWADLLEMDIPQDLHAELSRQKDACRQIIESKDRRIREFQTELRNKDEEYVRTLKQMASDITTTITFMRSQYHTLRESYAARLREVESAFEQDRSDLLEKNKKDIDALFERRRHMEETEFMDSRLERERRFQARIEELRTTDADEFNKSKIALERSIQELQLHLQRMVATYQLNREKLDYNLQVLTERHKEHSAIRSSYKSRLNRLRENLNNLMTRYAKLDQKYKQENLELTEEYKRLTRSFKDLQGKFHHFEVSDERKLREVWEMHETEARGLIEKVLQADKLIHEQQLGLEWTPPREDQLLQELETFSEAGTATGKSTALVSEEESGAVQSSSGRYAAAKVRKVLDLVKEETGFLLDMRVRDQMADLPADQRDVLMIDAVLRYVGAESQEDVDLLVSLFFQGQDEDDETLMVDADDVLKLLRDFIQQKEQLLLSDVAPDRKRKRKRQAVGGESEAERKARRRREERKFWERMSHVIPDMNRRVWVVLDAFLKKYYGLLQRRSDVIDDAVLLQKQNEELKQLLDQYLGSKVNEQLLVPPTHIIRVPAGGGPGADSSQP